MGVPWTYGPRQFTVPAGESSLVQLNVPYRGTIRSFSLAAPDGGGGTFELYNAEEPARAAVAAGNGSSESVGAAIPPANYVIYDGTLDDGISVDRELNIPYVNRDGTPSDGVSRLWLRLTPDGSDDLVFVISLTIESVNLV